MTESPLHELYVDRSHRKCILKRAELLLSRRSVNGYYSEIDLSSSEDDNTEDDGWLSDRSEKRWNKRSKNLVILKKSLLRNQRITSNNRFKLSANEESTKVSTKFHAIYRPINCSYVWVLLGDYCNRWTKLINIVLQSLHSPSVRTQQDILDQFRWVLKLTKI